MFLIHTRLGTITDRRSHQAFGDGVIAIISTIMVEYPTAHQPSSPSPVATCYYQITI